METVRYRAIAADLRHRIESGVFAVGTKLPPITALMKEYDVKGLNTVRMAQQLLVDEGLLRAEQGVGVWVLANRSSPSTAQEILEDLTQAQAALTRAINHLKGAQHA